MNLLKGVYYKKKKGGERGDIEVIDRKNGTQICPHPTVLLQCSFHGFLPPLFICISSLPSPECADSDGAF